MASRFLRKAGYRTLARNLHTPGGEADLVCIDRRTGALVLVEVKTRIKSTAGKTVSPTAAIHADKRRRLVRTAKSLAKHPHCAGRPLRIDVVTVEYQSKDNPVPEIRHFVNAVTADAARR